ncbi:MAG TPA: hypothetical protein VIT91_07765 [Chthoniobacterales bacterium]
MQSRSSNAFIATYECVRWVAMSQGKPGGMLLPRNKRHSEWTDGLLQ